MDQTPVHFLIHPNKTTKVCQKINLQSSTDYTKRCIVDVTITASGHKLPLFVVLKARDQERLQKELHKYKKDQHMSSNTIPVFLDAILL